MLQIENWSPARFQQNGFALLKAAVSDQQVLHSSSQSVSPDHRRVLHIEYAANNLPSGLEWADGSE